MRVEPRCRQPGETRLGERGAIELEERRGNGMEPEGITLLEDDTGKLAPDFDDEWFGDGLHHRLNLLLDLEMVMIRRSGNGEGCRISPFVEQITCVRHQYGARNFLRWRSRRHDERMKSR
jgi:hypothetical protein